jgi:hypothetical protein
VSVGMVVSDEDSDDLCGMAQVPAPSTELPQGQSAHSRAGRWDAGAWHVLECRTLGGDQDLYYHGNNDRLQQDGAGAASVPVVGPVLEPGS